MSWSLQDWSWLSADHFMASSSTEHFVFLLKTHRELRIWILLFCFLDSQCQGDVQEALQSQFSTTEDICIILLDTFQPHVFISVINTLCSYFSIIPFCIVFLSILLSSRTTSLFKYFTGASNGQTSNLPVPFTHIFRWFNFCSLMNYVYLLKLMFLFNFLTVDFGLNITACYLVYKEIL